jgi:formate hydrogenlyase subunit 6/NADH:ubiquinone oxidoreductase subunit I
MKFPDFAEGPLFWIVSILFVAVVLSRLFFFFLKIVGGPRPRGEGAAYPFHAMGRALFPLHKVFRKNFAYAALRYIFHFCLFVTPLWLSGHIMLLSESRLRWDWAALPDAWADRMTLLVMAIALFFLIRRAFFPGVRSFSSARDFWIILLTALPFVSGYFLTHGTLDSIKFVSDNIRTFHVLSGEAMIVMAAFLFCRTRMNPAACTGCAACELSCPTGTLESRDEASLRIFTYSHYQCICCGSCVDTCPENAAQLRHEVSLVKFFQVAPKLEIRKVEMKPCTQCGALFAPEPLMTKIGKSFQDEYLRFCPNCRKTRTGELLRRLNPSPRVGSPGAKGREVSRKAA